jgi:hypothetical protein
VGYLGIPDRVIYESKFFRTGLTNVMALVLKPNGSMSGPYSLIELPGPMAGRYSFDYMTSISDPEGEYFAMIYSPSDSLQTTKRLSLYLKPNDLQPQIDILNEQIALLTSMMTSLLASTIPPNIYGEVFSSKVITGIIFDSEIEGMISDDFSINGKIEESEEIGMIETDSEIIINKE